MPARIGMALLCIACLVTGGMPGLSVASPPGKKCPYDTQACLNSMVKKMSGQGWLGIEYENQPGPDHMKLVRVVPGSPADAAGFRAGDVLISVNGARFADNTEDRCVTCSASKDVWKPGGKVDYVVRRDGEEIELSATLAKLPPDVMAMMIGMHMLLHANPSPDSGQP